MRKVIKWVKSIFHPEYKMNEKQKNYRNISIFFAKTEIKK
jgi:hypothetical protein